MSIKSFQELEKFAETDTAEEALKALFDAIEEGGSISYDEKYGICFSHNLMAALDRADFLLRRLKNEKGI